jgi:hypothetical protein
LSSWDLGTGRRRAAVLAANFEAAFEPLRSARSWWPRTTSYSAWTLLRCRELGPAEAVADPVLRSWLHGALREWGATRSGVIAPGGLATRLTRPAFRDALRAAGGLSLTDFRAARHGEVLATLFHGLEGIKASNAQLVAVSKGLYHLLPELIVPFDNVITCGFFGWTRLPNRADDAWLADVYGILARVARAVGRRTLRELGRHPWARDPDVAGALRLGQARVLDFGMEGYRRSRGMPWYVD